MTKTIFYKILKVLINSFIAGIILAFGCLGYLYFYNYIGMIILGISFILCMLYAYDAYLIKIPYVLENNPFYLVETIISLFGNIIGILIVAALLYATDFYGSCVSIDLLAASLIEYNHFEMLVFSLFSGILLYFGINTYKKAEQPIARFLVLIVCCIATSCFAISNLYYMAFIAFAKNFNGNLWSKFFTVLIGNTLGLLSVPLLRKLRNKF